MGRKQKRQNSQSKTSSSTLVPFLGLLIGYLEYFVDIRPKLGQYQRGFFDCLLIILLVLVLWFEVSSKRG